MHAPPPRPPHTLAQGIVSAFDAVAKEFYDAAGGKPDPRIRFAIALSEDDAAEGVRRFLGPAHSRDKDGADAARLTIINIPARQKAMWNGGKVGLPSADDIRAFVNSFLEGKAATVGAKE